MQSVFVAKWWQLVSEDRPMVLLANLLHTQTLDKSGHELYAADAADYVRNRGDILKRSCLANRLSI